MLLQAAGGKKPIHIDRAGGWNRESVKTLIRRHGRDLGGVALGRPASVSAAELQRIRTALEENPQQGMQQQQGATHLDFTKQHYEVPQQEQGSWIEMHMKSTPEEEEPPLPPPADVPALAYR